MYKVKKIKFYCLIRVLMALLYSIPICDTLPNTFQKMVPYFSINPLVFPYVERTWY